MTAAEAVDHSWYTKPASEAKALANGIKRINRFWKQRDVSSDEVLEVGCHRNLSDETSTNSLSPLQGLPGVGLSAPGSKDAHGPNFRRKIPDATSSPYFGLDRHLNQKAPSGRKRLLDDLNESGSPFVTSTALQQRKLEVSIGAHRGGSLSRVVSMDGTDLFGMSLVKTKMATEELEAEIEIIDLDHATPDPGRRTALEMADLRLTTGTLGVEKRLCLNHSSLGRSTLSWEHSSENASLSDTKGPKRVSTARVRTSESPPKGQSKVYTSRGFGGTVRKVKL